MNKDIEITTEIFYACTVRDGNILNILIWSNSRIKIIIGTGFLLSSVPSCSYIMERPYVQLRSKHFKISSFQILKEDAYFGQTVTPMHIRMNGHRSKFKIDSALIIYALFFGPQS